MTDAKHRHTIACVPLPEDECICPDLVPGCRRPSPVLSTVSDTPIADAAEAAGHNVITMDDIRVDPLTAGLFKDSYALPTQITYPAALEGTGVLTIPDPGTNLVSIHNTEGELTAAYTLDGNLIGGSLHRELLHLTAHKSYHRNVVAQRDTAVENANFWRRNCVVAMVLCLGWMGYAVGNTLGWF